MSGSGTGNRNGPFNPTGSSLAGPGVGILHIENQFPIVAGHLQHASSLGIPVDYECVAGIEPKQIIATDQAVEQAIVDAAKRLQARGVRAIIGTCGSFVNYHDALVDAVEIPVFSSIMMAVPMLLRTTGPHTRIAVIFASSSSLTDRAMEQAGIADRSRLAVTDCTSLPAFEPILRNDTYLDSPALESQLAEHVSGLLEQEPGISMLVLQCSELAPYAATLRGRFGKPVFDINSLTHWVHRALSDGCLA